MGGDGLITGRFLRSRAASGRVGRPVSGFVKSCKLSLRTVLLFAEKLIILKTDQYKVQIDTSTKQDPILKMV